MKNIQNVVIQLPNWHNCKKHSPMKKKTKKQKHKAYENLMKNMVSLVGNNVLDNWNSLRENLNFLTKK